MLTLYCHAMDPSRDVGKENRDRSQAAIYGILGAMPVALEKNLKGLFLPLPHEGKVIMSPSG